MSGFRKRTIDQKIIDFNRANTDVPRYKIIISGGDFDQVFMVDTNNLNRSIAELKSIVIASRGLTLIETRFLRIHSQILPLS